VYFHDNNYMMNGTAPDITSDIGAVLATGLSAYPGGTVPDVLWDGIVPDGTTGANPQMICVNEPHASAVCNLHFDKLDTSNPNEAAIIACDATPFNCTLPALAAVSFPGLTPDMP
jgi:hypothetical protein